MIKLRLLLLLAMSGCATAEYEIELPDSPPTETEIFVDKRVDDLIFEEGEDLAREFQSNRKAK